MASEGRISFVDKDKKGDRHGQKSKRPSRSIVHLAPSYVYSTFPLSF